MRRQRNPQLNTSVRSSWALSGSEDTALVFKCCYLQNSSLQPVLGVGTYVPGICVVRQIVENSSFMPHQSLVLEKHMATPVAIMLHLCTDKEIS